MSSLASVNDPKETKFRDFVFYARGAKSLSSFNSAYFDRVVSDLTSRTFAFCAGTESDDERVGIDGALRSHMWANYADRHRGVCLVFDKDKLQKVFESAAGGRKLYSGYVNYYSLKEYRSKTSSAYYMYFEDWLKDERGFLEHHIHYYHEPLFFSKYLGWRDEHEYRWVLRGGDDKEVYADFGAALVKVIVGSDIHIDKYDKVLDWCREKDVSMHRVVWNATGSLSPDLRETRDKVVLNIDASYSRLVPSVAVVFRVTNGYAEFENMAISGKNGNVLWLDRNADKVSSELLEQMGFTENELGVDVDPVGFSAARLADTEFRPLNYVLDGMGKCISGAGEELMYYGGYTVFNRPI
ncbi:DUF2971 domain-containing protein [Pseudomonas capsici]|uniref:DUF2971 domain-containing protein n=1 Tax=Pseudomonas capsici TaxID=2810614 RepID=UPI0021F24C17|nr:DUF2971 domain-containing protein [Pseudomonas capsici]MCV4281963.1 DUF2971 domain-containing protein [Pseudomonas capsici]